MNRDDIERMAREAGFEINSLGTTYTSGRLPDLLERFAALVAAAEREACAKVCDDMDVKYEGHFVRARLISEAIRARGQG